MILFGSLVTKDVLRKQYPNAGDLIACLPASWAWCSKPEACLLIEKFLSLKKENSRNFFIANMAQHTRDRHEVSSIFASSEERSSTLSQSSIFSLGQYKGQYPWPPVQVDLNWTCREYTSTTLKLSEYVVGLSICLVLQNIVITTCQPIYLNPPKFKLQVLYDHVLKKFTTNSRQTSENEGPRGRITSFQQNLSNTKTLVN